jgi:peptidoglycan hydrolase-like protein with peptidoglycan-binding domain
MITLSFRKVLICIGLLSLMALSAKAVNPGSLVIFHVDSNFDAGSRPQVQAVLIKTTPSLYVYIEKIWWDSQSSEQQQGILAVLDDLSSEFENRMYPTLTSMFGPERKPGIDGDNHITLLFHFMKDGVGGYFRSDDGYSKLQIPGSNEREMVYLSVDHLQSPFLKGVLAHEFTHLIQFNQKDNILGVTEDIWLNEGRSEIAAMVLGYDMPYEGSNLQKRVNDFLVNPKDALISWQESKYDYAVVNLFLSYLTDHYGMNILTDSLKLKSAGIDSLNKALANNGFRENIGQIFTDWTITLTINNCSENIKYCYKNQSLKQFKVNPSLNFLPVVGNSSLSVVNTMKNWSANWQKVIGGNGDLKLTFTGFPGLVYQVPYILYDKSSLYTVNFLSLDQNQKGQITIKDFGGRYSSLVIVPSLQSAYLNGRDQDASYSYSFTVAIDDKVMPEDQVVIDRLLAQIESLKKQIATLLALGNGDQLDFCQQISTNLYSGLSNNNQVRCLQQFLKNQGETIYPEGLVTGNFAQLTRSAVIRFQLRYNIPSTGFVGTLTRSKINQILNEG